MTCLWAQKEKEGEMLRIDSDESFVLDNRYFFFFFLETDGNIKVSEILLFFSLLKQSFETKTDLPSFATKNGLDFI